MFSVIEVSPWDWSVQRPTVDPNRETVRDDSDMETWSKLEISEGVLRPLRGPVHKSVISCQNVAKMTLFCNILHSFVTQKTTFLQHPDSTNY